MIKGAFWELLVADGSVPVGLYGDSAGTVMTGSGRVVGNVPPEDQVETLVASGRWAAWVAYHLYNDDGPGAYDYVIHLASITGKPVRRVVATCQTASGVVAVGGPTLAYGCGSSRIDLMSLTSGRKQSVTADGPVDELEISGHYLAAAIDSELPYPFGVSQEVEVFDLRSIAVANRVMTPARIESYAISTSGAVATTQGFYALNPPLFYNNYAGDECQHPSHLVVQPIGRPARTIDTRACPFPVVSAGSRFVYSRIEGSGAAVVIADPAGRRQVVRWLGRSRNELTLYALAANARSVLYTDGTCANADGGFPGISSFLQPLSNRAKPRPAAPIACPVAAKLPRRLTLPTGKRGSRPREVQFTIRCPIGCTDAGVTLSTTSGPTGFNDYGISLASGRQGRARAFWTPSPTNKPVTAFADVGGLNRTGTWTLSTKRTIRITFCNPQHATCRRKLTPSTAGPL
ncbi:MAG: hypothetical protein M3071_22795 [Actinomycetota bacterium]|nr:hypothetical protein [Actinomycetota bacterium]